MDEIFALPSNEPTPNVLILWLIAIDCNWEPFPKSELSAKAFEFWFKMSMISTFSAEVQATRVGNWKSLANTLL